MGPVEYSTPPQRPPKKFPTPKMAKNALFRAFSGRFSLSRSYLPEFWSNDHNFFFRLKIWSKRTWGNFFGAGRIFYAPSETHKWNFYPKKLLKNAFFWAFSRRFSTFQDHSQVLRLLLKTTRVEKYCNFIISNLLRNILWNPEYPFRTFIWESVKLYANFGK